MGRGLYLSFLEKCYDLIELIYLDGVEFLLECLDFFFCLNIRPIVCFCIGPISFILPILSHHDDRSSIGGLCREEEIEEDKRIYIPMIHPSYNIADHPENYDNGLDDDKIPRSHSISDCIRESLSEVESIDMILVPGFFRCHRI